MEDILFVGVSRICDQPPVTYGWDYLIRLYDDDDDLAVLDPLNR
jgi:hypothetical protein